MAHQRRHFCNMEEKAEKKRQELKDIERNIDLKTQQCQAMMADIAKDSRRRKEEEERRIAEHRGIDEDGNLVDSEEERYMEACVAAREAEADPHGTPRRRSEEGEEEVPGSPSSTYSYVDDGNPFRHGKYLDDT